MVSDSFVFFVRGRYFLLDWGVFLLGFSCLYSAQSSLCIYLLGRGGDGGGGRGGWSSGVNFGALDWFFFLAWIRTRTWNRFQSCSVYFFYLISDEMM